MDIKARDLLAEGWSEGPRFGAILRRARELARTSANGASLWQELEREFPKDLPVILPRDLPAPLAEAITPESTEETVNVAAARARMRELLHVPIIKRGAIMPDACPSGPGFATIPVGGAIETENAIIPGAHSADICCSLFASFFGGNHPVKEMMDHLEKTTHFGAGGRPRGKQWSTTVTDEPVWDNPFLSGLQGRGRDFLGTQGDGNHFAYLGSIRLSNTQCDLIRSAGHLDLAEAIERHEGDFSVLVTHHGSRALGADLYTRGQKAARHWCDLNAKGIPDSAAWLPYDSAEGRAYWDALQYVSRWTRENHRLIHEAFLKRLGQRPLAQVGNEHNFVWKRGSSFFHGKGATPAWKDEQNRPLLGLIPLNMAREILIVLGNDNDDFLSFCPHGAGRNLSRKAMLRPYRDNEGVLDPLRVKEALAKTTRGLDIRWYNGAPDLSESPLGYKDATKVKEEIQRFGLATVVGEISPLGCIMAGEAPEPPWAKARREKKAHHKTMRREARAEAEEE